MRLIEALISALMVAGLYATMSYGLALIYGVMKIINLANAGPMMLASFATFFLWQTFGLDPLAMQAGASFFLGGDVRSVRPVYIQEVVHFGDVTLAYNRIFVFLAGLIILVALELFLRNTFLGRAIRALAQDRDACRLAGIDVQRVSMIAFGLGTALAGAAGALLTAVFPFDPSNP